MNLRILLISIAIILCCTACSEKKYIEVHQQSFVRWNENNNELEVYVVVQNPTDQDKTFEASIVFLDQKLKDSVGLASEELESDDRNNNSPFRLISHNETVFQRFFLTKSKLSKEVLNRGVGIKITEQEDSYTLPIKHIEFD